MLTDRQKEVYECYVKNDGNLTAVHNEIGISLTAIRKNLFYCAVKGYNLNNKSAYCEHAPEGWGTFFSTIQWNKDGVVQQWDRVRPIEENSEQLFEYLKARVPATKLTTKKPTKVDPKTQLEWTLADIHYGMLAWRKETGEDYDIKIARSLILDSASDIFARAGKVKETVLVLMGDNFHTDFYSGLTEDSKNALDVDTRFPKMIKTGLETFVSAAEICLQFSESVKVIVLYGNHDKQTSSTTLPYFLWAWFRNEPRIKIDLSPAKQHYNFWGKTGTVYHHGDKTHKARICSDFLLYCARSGFKNLEFFYAKQGHLHKELIEDINGVTFEIVPSPLAKEHYASAANYTAKRATVATMYHKDYGELDRYSITPHALKLKKESLKK